MKDLGYGRGYDYPHTHPDALTTQVCLPDALAGRRYYEPTDRGAERALAERSARPRRAGDS
jgi:putative ATPase